MISAMFIFLLERIPLFNFCSYGMIYVNKKYLREQKIVLVHHGNLLVCYHYLILLGMIVLKLLKELSNLV